MPRCSHLARIVLTLGVAGSLRAADLADWPVTEGAPGGHVGIGSPLGDYVMAYALGTGGATPGR